MKTIFISGVSSGIGRGLAEEYIRRGDRVFAIGRHENKSLISHPHFTFLAVDYNDPDLVHNTLRDFFHRRTFDKAILNAAIYPDMQSIVDTTLEEMRHLMDINVWSKKHVIDALLSHTQTDQVVALSASPTWFNHRGFGGYAISKTALNTLIQLYAEEFPTIHFSSLAPELIQTPAFSTFLQEANSKHYPLIQEMRDGFILPLDQAVPKLIDAFEEVKRLRSGSFVEMKKLGQGHY